MNPPSRTLIYEKVEALYFEDGYGREVKVSVQDGPLVGNRNGSIAIHNVRFKRKPWLNYPRLLRIEAQKGSDSLWPYEKFGHDFKHADTFNLLGSTLTISSSKGRKLWKKFNYD